MQAKIYEQFAKKKNCLEHCKSGKKKKVQLCVLSLFLF